MFFISDAFADAGSSQSAGFMGFLPIIACVAILYFLLIRPQQKRQKQHQELISSIKKGDKVVTNSGIIATVSKVISEHEVVLEIADGVHCRFVKTAISDVVENTIQNNVAKSVEKDAIAEDKAKINVDENAEKSASEPAKVAGSKTETKKTIRKVTSKKKN